MVNYIVRGILIGGSFGVFGALFGLTTMGRGAALGMIAGFFAGWTLERKRARKEAAKKDS